MKKVSSEKKILNKKKLIEKLDIMTNDNTNLPLWAKLRVAIRDFLTMSSGKMSCFIE